MSMLFKSKIFRAVIFFITYWFFFPVAYAEKGDKQNAVKWYEVSKRMVNDPKYSKEVDARIKQLK